MDNPTLTAPPAPEAAEAPPAPKRPSWPRRHPIATGLIIAFILGGIGASSGSGTSDTTPGAQATDSASVPDSGSGSGSVSAPADSAPAELTTAEKTDLFLTLVRAKYPGLNSVPDYLIVGLALESCNLFEQGETAEDIARFVAADAVANDRSIEFVRAVGGVVGAGTAAFCPEYGDQVRGLDS